jgi:2Fe-2S ferredoxin
MSTTVTFHLQSADGTPHTLCAKAGQSLMQAAMDAGIAGITADCGGVVSCATCHVIVAPEWAALLEAPDEDEEAMLAMTAAPREPTSRLACQITLTPALEGLAARLPVRQF